MKESTLSIFRLRPTIRGQKRHLRKKLHCWKAVQVRKRGCRGLLACAAPPLVEEKGKLVEVVSNSAGTETSELDSERLTSGAFASTSTSLIGEEVEKNKFEELIQSGKPKLSVEEVASAFKFPLDKFQKDAMKEFLDGHSVVVCAPTGAGKTAIAEAAAISVLARGGRIIYTTPLKALSNQKLQEMRVQFGQERVGLQTGEASLNAEGQVVIMTTEVLRNILFRVTDPEADAARDRMKDVGLVVLDEVHYLGDPGRGSVWEEVIISCPREVPLLCMSATVQNPEELGGWISKVHGSCKTIVTDFRPIPLTWDFCYTAMGETSALPLLNRKGRLNGDLDIGEGEEDFKGFGSRKADRRRRRNGSSRRLEKSMDRVPSIEEALQVLRERELLPSIWFSFSRMGCDNSALRLHQQNVCLVDAEEQSLISDAVSKLQADQPEAIREAMVPPLLLGVASHHAGCLPAWKCLIEDLYKQGLIKVVFATGTLAAGINMPARSTVISTITRRVATGFITLKHNELLQMAGRAGRRGYDVEGHCVVLQDHFSSPQTVVDILLAGPEPLRSHFATGFGMVLKLLHHRTLKSARAFVERSFYNYLAEEGVQAILREIEAADKQAEDLLLEAGEAEAEAGGTEAKFQSYLELKKQYADAKKVQRAVVKAANKARALVLEKILASATLPMIVGLESNPQDLEEEGDFLPALLVSRKGGASKKLMYENNCTCLCLTADNRLFQVEAQHIAATGRSGLGGIDIQPILEAVRGKANWRHVKLGSFAAEGSALTASIAAKISGKSLEAVVLDEEKGRLSDAQEAVDSARELAKDARSMANQAKAYRKDLQLRAEATKAKRRAREMRSALTARSKYKESNWRSFESTLNVLIKAGALEGGTLIATPLGQVAREINCKNELWLAIVLTHPSIQMLPPAELAGVLSAMVAGEAPMRPNITVTYACSDNVQHAVEMMEGERSNLYFLQAQADISSPLTVDLRLTGLVEAWAAGATWEQITQDCSVDGGDVARLFSRTVDILRQASHCESLLPTVRETSRKAAKAMSRKPITDLIQ